MYATSDTEEFAVSPSSHVEASEESLRVETSWPQVTKANALLEIPSFAKRDLLDGRGESTFQRRATRELVKENKDPVKHVAKSKGNGFPWGEKAHLTQDVLEAVQFVSDNESNFPKFFFGEPDSKSEAKNHQML